MRILIPAFLPLLASTLCAQTTVSLVAATPIAALTSIGGGTSTTFDGKPSGQAIGSYPNSIGLSTSQTVGSNYASAHTICHPSGGYQGSAGFNFFERAYARGSATESAGSSASASSAGATFGGHSVLATFSAAHGTVGRITISWRNNVPATGSASMAIDIGNDGVVEFAQSQAQEISVPYTFGASGQIQVLVTNECRSTGDGTTSTVYTWTELYVHFRPDLTATSTFTPYGQGCSGVTLSATDLVVGNQRTLFMLGTNCFPNSVVVVAFGHDQMNLPLLQGCSLLCNAEWLMLASSDAAGNATLAQTFPATTVGTVFSQFLPLMDSGGALVITASNGVRIDLVH
jgi:hypothetical protein